MRVNSIAAVSKGVHWHVVQVLGEDWTEGQVAGNDRVKKGPSQAFFRAFRASLCAGETEDRSAMEWVRSRRKSRCSCGSDPESWCSLCNARDGAQAPAGWRVRARRLCSSKSRE